MTSELLFGDLFKSEEASGEWLRIRTEWDEYSGWVNNSQVMLMDEPVFQQFMRARRAHTTQLLTEIKDGSDRYHVSAGSTLFELRGGEVQAQYKRFIKPAELIIENLSGRNEVTGNAMLFLHCPYRWGGRSAFGIDCSGLVQIAFKMAGVRVPRDSSDQVATGSSVSLISEALPADVAFFDDEEGNIIHTGILLENNRIIHASGRVRIDAIDHHGIYDLERKRYIYQLRTIRRFFSHP